MLGQRVSRVTEIVQGQRVVCHRDSVRSERDSVLSQRECLGQRERESSVTERMLGQIVSTVIERVQDQRVLCHRENARSEKVMCHRACYVTENRESALSQRE